MLKGPKYFSLLIYLKEKSSCPPLIIGIYVVYPSRSVPRYLFQKCMYLHNPVSFSGHTPELPTKNYTLANNSINVEENPAPASPFK